MLSRRRSTRLSRRLAPLLLSLVFLPPAVLPAATAAPAPPPWDEPFAGDPAAILEAAAALPPSEEGVRVLLEEMEVVFHGKHRVTSRLRRVYRVEEEWAVDGWGQVYAPWSPWFEERPEVRARVMTPDGRVRHLDPATVLEMPRESVSQEVLSDALSLRAALPGMVVGAVVEEEITIRQSSPLPPIGVSGRFVFGAAVPTEATRLVLEAPLSLPLAWRVHALAVEPVETVEEDRRRLVFTRGQQEALEWPSDSLPGDVRQIPQVTWSTDGSWADVAAAYAGVVEAQLAGSDLAAVVAQVAPPEMERGDRIAALTAWVHGQARYTSVALGEASLVPRSPAEVLERGYGDCKDKSTLLVGLLREAGIAAQVALVATGPGEDVEPDLPGLGRFDHAIVRVPPAAGEEGDGDGEGGVVWIDATAPTWPPGLVPSGVAGRLALPAVARGGDLVPIPHLRPEDDRQVIRRDLHLSDFGKGRIVQVTEDHGAAAAWRRSWWRSLDEEDLEAQMELYVEETWPGANLVSWSIEGLEDLSAPLVHHLEVDQVQSVLTGLVDAAVAMDGTEVVVDLPLGLYLEEGEESGGQEDPVAKEGNREGEAGNEAGKAGAPGSPLPAASPRLQEPHVRELHARIVTPPGLVLVEHPEDDEISIGPSVLTRRFDTSRDGEVRFEMHLHSGGPRIEPEELAQGADGVQRLIDEDPLMLIYADGVQQHLNAGRVAEAIRQGRQLVEAQPESGAQRVRLALALLAGGLGEAAREEARAAAALAPEVAEVQGHLGTVLVHDEVGRQLQPGWDREGAIAALRRARDLDPENFTYRQNLALALERNAEARQYGEGSDLQAALAEWRVLEDDLGITNGQVNLLQGLAHAREYEELEERAREVDPTREVHAMLLVAVTALRGSEAAVQEALSWEADPRRSALALASVELFDLRLWGEAAELLTLAAEGSPDPAGLLEMADRLRRTRRHEELELDPTDPGSILRNLFVAVLDPDPAALEDLLERVPGLSEDLPDEEMEAMREEAERSLDETLGKEAGLDLVTSWMELTRQDREGVGVRVAPRMFSGAGSSTDLGYLYCAERDGVLHWLTMVDPEETPAELGREVLRRLDAGGEADLVAARQWLDWAREEAVAPSFDDPLRGDPLALFWRVGQQGTGEEARLAAAALLAAHRNTAQEALALLDPAAQEAEGVRERLRFAVARIEALVQLGRHEDLVPLLEEVLVDYPGSDLAGFHLVESLRELERWGELRRWADQRLERRPEDLLALSAQVVLAFEEEDLEVARRWLVRAEEAADHGGGLLNQLAWLDVVEDRVDETSLERANRALQHGVDDRAAILHTVATLYAELDRPVQARDVLHQLVALRDGVLLPVDWYVVGRMAEAYGELDAARTAYGRVEESAAEDDGPLSTWRLAQRRLALLDGAGS